MFTLLLLISGWKSSLKQNLNLRESELLSKENNISLQLLPTVAVIMEEPPSLLHTDQMTAGKNKHLIINKRPLLVQYIDLILMKTFQNIVCINGVYVCCVNCLYCVYSCFLLIPSQHRQRQKRFNLTMRDPDQHCMSASLWCIYMSADRGCALFCCS